MKKSITPVEELTDRQLQEQHVKMLMQIAKKQKGIKDNLDFFFWITIVGIVIGVVTLFM